MTIIIYNANNPLIARDNTNYTITGGVTAGTEQTLYTTDVSAGYLTLINRFSFEFYLLLSTATVLPGTLTLKIYYGTQALILGGGSNLNLVANQTAMPFSITGRIRNVNASNVQYFYARTTQPQSGLTLTSQVAQSRVIGTQDSTTTLPIKLTAQFSASNSGNTITIEDVEFRMI